MSDICERWKWRDPAEIIDRLLAESASIGRMIARIAKPKPKAPRNKPDRYYTQARRLMIINAMKGQQKCRS
jgi:hypothetical protein